jgi:hypothetical protein
MRAIGAAVVAIVVALIVWLIVSLVGLYDARHEAFDKAERICAERGGAEAYDTEDANYIVYQCRDGKGRIARIRYGD